MQFLTRYWAQIRDYLGKLSYSEKAVAVMAVVVLVVVLGWMLTWASKPKLAPITQFAGEHQAQATAKLQAAGIPVTSSNGQLLVPQEKFNDALSILVNSDLLTPDSTAAFDEYIKHYSALLPNSQSVREFLLAKQKALGSLVQRMAGVQSATVMVSMPEEQGFGKPASRPSASVHVVMKPNKTVEKQMVAAIAGLVAGANSPMKPQDVCVIDANRGKQLTVGNENEDMPSETLAVLKTLEDHYREKIESTLGYISGLIVNVSVQTDPTLSRKVHDTVYEKDEPLKSDYTRDTTSHEGGGAAEAGARSNTTVDATASGGAARVDTSNE
jgi:flagellar M-ring protein FliF